MEYAETLNLLLLEGAECLVSGTIEAKQTVPDAVDARDFDIDSNMPRGIARMLEASSTSEFDLTGGLNIIALSLGQDDLTAFSVFVTHLQKTPEDLSA